jgi:hypothetical protein
MNGRFDLITDAIAWWRVKITSSYRAGCDKIEGAVKNALIKNECAGDVKSSSTAGENIIDVCGKQMRIDLLSLTGTE